MPGADLSTRGAACGLYGKLPAAGDFVTRTLPRAFVAPWDDWLQRCLVASRAQLGASWTGIYLQSPIWRFALQPQVCGPQAWIGVLLPSVDRAGRYFPLTFAAPVDAGASLLLTATASEHWFTDIERIALSALAPSTPVPTIEVELGRHPLEPVPRSASEQQDWAAAQDLARWWAAPERTLALRVPATRALTEIAGFAAVRLMETQGSGHALWWTGDGPGDSLLLRAGKGLPPAAEFAAYLRAVPGPP